jgi:hypothetical protein
VSVSRTTTRLLLPIVLALAAAPAAAADVADEQALAARHAPVLRLVIQEEDCGYGEPYIPLDVDLLFDEPTVALRGPWGTDDLIRIAPSEDDLSQGLYEHHLDFPGNALNPGCDYERWNDRLVGASPPTVYAHVVTDPLYPGRLALQYWLFYAFNDFNNKHEGDWEMIQLVFNAGDAAAARHRLPVEVGYSQHEGAERADWGDEKLELVDGTHPIVYAAAGSHANYFGEALHIGRSAAQGVGCDDTSEPTVELRPVVRTIPSNTTAAEQAFPWIGYEGRWGELQTSFYNGPTGPNLKRQWTEPIGWAEEDWRERSYATPGGGLLGTSATSFFCGAVGGGSDVLRRAVEDPLPLLVLILALLAFVVFALSRTTWRPTAPLRVMRRRAWGQTLAAAARMYVRHWPLFIGIGLAFIPVGALIAAQPTLVFGASTVVGIESEGESNGILALVVGVIATMLVLAGLGLVQGATTRALVEIDGRRPINPIRAYRLAVRRLLPNLGAVAIATVIALLLSATVVLIPFAIWVIGRWALIAQVIELESLSPRHALRRSNELVRGSWFKVVSLVVVGAAIALVLGPVAGALLIAGTNAPFWLLNIVSGLVYVLATPLVALTTTYVYFDAVVRERLGIQEGLGELPPEAD